MPLKAYEDLPFVAISLNSHKSVPSTSTYNPLSAHPDSLDMSVVA